MASFLTDLWTSVFTPGPTPTLVVATNISFFALQSILLALLIATYSIHFIILSFLSAGLWIGINWFVRELELANQREKEKAGKASKSGAGDGSEGDDEEDSHGSGTETEDAGAGGKLGGTDYKKADNTGAGTSKPERLLPEQQDATIRKRRSFGEGSSTGDLSTDSEWDKVEEAGEIKR